MKHSEENIEGITKDDIDRAYKKLSSLKNTSEKVIELREKYHNFQLQLIAIAGATFSIYIAIHSGTTAPGIYTKYGFIALAASLLLGLFSIATSFTYKWGAVIYDLFDFDKSIIDESDGVLRVLALTGIKQGLYYDDSVRKVEATKHGEIGLRVIRDFITSTLGSFSSLLGVGQVLAFIIATSLLTIGLIIL